jgi:Phage integrase, N-terminal SAM-like domain
MSTNDARTRGVERWPSGRTKGWQVIVYAGLDPLTGRQRQLTRQVNGSRRQAEKVEARLRTEVADGQHAGTRVRTLGELCDLWIERRVASDKPSSPDTVEDYRSLIAKKIKPALGGKRLHTINARVLDGFYDDLRRYGNAKAAAGARARARAEAAARGEDQDRAVATARPSASDQRLSANRVRDVHVILSGALGMAARWGWIPFNPALVVRPAGGKGKSRPGADSWAGPRAVRGAHGGAGLRGVPAAEHHGRAAAVRGLRIALAGPGPGRGDRSPSTAASSPPRACRRSMHGSSPRASTASGCWRWTGPRSSCFAPIGSAARSSPSSSAAAWTRRRTCSLGHRTVGRLGGRTR